LSGLGDSIQESGENENDSYPGTAFRDIEITLRHVQQKFGARRIVLMGLCSGAYAAFQSAAQITDPALVESVLINPLTYFWKEGMTLEASPTKHLMSFHYYKKKLLNPISWFRLLTGKSRLGMTGAIKILAKTFGRNDDVRPSNAVIRPSEDANEYRSHPEKEDLPGDLKRIVGLNRQLTMFFSKADPGFSILNHHAKRKARELRAKGRLTVSFIEDADHTFSRNAARSELIDSIAQHFVKRYSK
jgi:hypothetical protein